MPCLIFQTEGFYSIPQYPSCLLGPPSVLPSCFIAFRVRSLPCTFMNRERYIKYGAFFCTSYPPSWLCAWTYTVLYILFFRKECETSNKELKNKLVMVEQSCEAVETEAMLHGTATQPAPCLMVEWAQDAWRMYHMLYPL